MRRGLSRQPRWRLSFRLPQAVMVAGLGLGAQEVAYRVASSMAEVEVDLLFFSGLLLITIPLAVVVAGRQTSRSVRLSAGVIMTELMLVSRWLVHPSMFASFDSLLHLTTLWQLVDQRRFLSQNNLLPVSGYYPGLELVTAGVHWITGLPTLPAQLVTLLLARALLVTALYLAFERVTHSGRSAGIGVLLYAANPEFYNFDAQYAYETLALAWAAIGAYYVLRTLDASRARDAGSGPILASPAFPVSFRSAALGVLTAFLLLTVTHHVISWVVAVGAVVVAGLLIRDSRSARVVLAVAILDVLVVGLWTLFVGTRIASYLGPLLQQALSSVGGILVGRQHTKSLFIQPVGTGTPGWQRALIVASVIAWVLLIVVATVSRSVRGAQRRSRALVLLALCSPGYLAIEAARLSPAATEFGNRAAALIFVPVACTIGVWWVASKAATRPRTSVVVLSVLLVGGVAVGTGPYYLRYPGRYLVEADERSVDGPSLDAAQWAHSHLPTGLRIGADRDNSAVMSAVGHLSPVTQASGSVNVGQLFFAKSIGPGEIGEIRHGRIRLLLVDHRLSRSLPYEGVYFEPGETAQLNVSGNTTVQITAADIDKFDTWKSAVLIHRDGPISIYDLSKVLGLPPVPVSRVAAPPGDLATTDWWPLGSVLALLVMWLVTTPRARRRSSDPLARLLGAGVVASVLCVAMASLVVVTPGSQLWLVLPFLGLVALGMLQTRRPRLPAPTLRRRSARGAGN